MKKVIASVVGLLAVFWITLFATDGQVLVWETKEYFISYPDKRSGSGYSQFKVSKEFLSLDSDGRTTAVKEFWQKKLTDCEKDRQRRMSTASGFLAPCKDTVVNIFGLLFVVDKPVSWNWKCIYFNGRRFLEGESSRHNLGCPNFRSNTRRKR
jgi:hypothetical protein